MQETKTLNLTDKPIENIWKTKIDQIFAFCATHKVLVGSVLVTLLCIQSMFATTFSYVAVLMAFVYILYLDFNGGLIIVASFMPYSCLAKIFKIDAGFIVVLSFYVLVSFIRLVRARRFKFNKPMVILAIALLVYMLLPIGGYSTLKFGYTGIYALFCLACVVFWILRKEINFLKIVHLSVIFLLVSCLAWLLAHIWPVNPDFYFFYVHGYRYPALFANPNYLSMLCIILSSILVSETIIGHNRLRSLFYLFATILLGFSTLSKTFMLLAIVLVAILVIYFLAKMFKTSKTRRISIVILIIFGLAVVCFMMALISRFGSFKTMSFSKFVTGRDTLWDDAIDKWLTNVGTIIFGNGMGSLATDRSAFAHSFYLEFLQKLGLVGFFMLEVLIVMAFRIVMETKQSKSKVMFLPMMIILVYALTETLIVVFPVIFVLFIAVAFMDFNQDLSPEIITFHGKMAKVETKINASFDRSKDETTADK